MKKIFVDTNILLDVVLARPPFMHQASLVWADCESGKVTGFVSAISLNNMHFILSKIVGKEAALESVRLVLEVFKTEALTEKILRLAAELPHKDFEDAIQLFSAVHAKAECLVTRDTGHFAKGYLPIITPAEYPGMRK